ncbi:MAG: hypothetical protein WC298_07370 [Sideroxydans sp.]|jgi:hypothetical protein
MSSQPNPLEQLEIDELRSWLCEQNEYIQLVAVLEVVRMRIMDVSDSIFTLRYLHSESTLQAVLEKLSEPSLSLALGVFAIDHARFAYAVETEVRKRGTTRPDSHWSACGVGRPKREGKK